MQRYNPFNILTILIELELRALILFKRVCVILQKYFEMIEFNFELDFKLTNESLYKKWINSILTDYGFELGDISYIFCDDMYLLNINQQYLNHDDLTDIISFDYTEGRNISGDIFISIERVKENANQFMVDFNEELLRVMAHGLLHFMGFKDKTQKEAELMRQNEEKCMKKFVKN